MYIYILDLKQNDAKNLPEIALKLLNYLLLTDSIISI